jgi:hypothetical protein
VARWTFSQWVLKNEIVFTSPYDSAGLGRYYAHFTVRHPLPENRKSQFIYLRPDLGTQIYRYDQYDQFSATLGVEPARTHNTTAPSSPFLTDEAREYLHRSQAWDFEATRKVLAA